MQTAIQLGMCKSVPFTDLNGVVTPKDMESKQQTTVKKQKKKGTTYSEQYVVQKGRIINKISKKIN